jgi:hypothetical protein
MQIASIRVLKADASQAVFATIQLKIVTSYLQIVGLLNLLGTDIYKTRIYLHV